MINFKATLEEVNKVFCTSCSRVELGNALTVLDGLLGERNLNETNRADAEALRMRLKCKIFSIAYFDKFDGAELAEVEKFLTENAPVAAEKGYGNSLAVMERTADVIRRANKYVAGIGEYYSLIKSGAALSDIAENMNNLLSDFDGENFCSPFGTKVEIFEIKPKICERLALRKTDVVCAFADRLEQQKACKKLDYAKYVYYPLPDYDEGGKANALILNTPFADEARLYVAHCVPQNVEIYEFDCGLFSSAKDGLECAFLLGEYKKAALLFVGTDEIEVGMTNELLIRAMRFGKTGGTVFLCDVLGGELYERAVKIACETDGLGALDISSAYITMPLCGDVDKELTSLGMIAGTDDRSQLAEMPFLGFMGLNEITRTENMLHWVSRGKKISALNAQAAARYLMRIKSTMLFIDDGWGDFAVGGKTDDEFDYDELHTPDIADIKRISECGASAFSICGMIARYCTTGTGDYSEWNKISRETMEERITLATTLVLRTLRVPVTPIVEVVDELENGSAGGLCYDGGKRIAYKYDCCKDVGWVRDAIVHECFHALQAKLVNGGFSQWYYDNLGITFGRVCEWKNTRDHKYDGNTKSDVYNVHMYEADARAFEVDCSRGASSDWGKVEFE